MKHDTTFGLALLLLLMQPMLALAGKALPDATLTGHTGPVIAVAFSPDGSKLASVSDDGHFKLWDLAAKKELWSVDDASDVKNQIRFTPDGQTVIALGRQVCVLVVDVASGKAKAPIKIENLHGGPKALDLSPDGKTVAIVGNSSLRFYDLATGAAAAAYEIHNLYGINGVAYSPDGKRVATAAADKTSIVMDVATAKIVWTFDLVLRGEDVLFTRDGKMLITNSSDSIIRSFDTQSGEGKTLIDNAGTASTLAISPDGKQLVLATSHRSVSLVPLPDGKPVAEPFDCEGWVKSAVISPDGKWLAGGSNGGAIYLWKLAN